MTSKIAKHCNVTELFWCIPLRTQLFIAVVSDTQIKTSQGRKWKMVFKILLVTYGFFKKFLYKCHSTAAINMTAKVHYSTTGIIISLRWRQNSCSGISIRLIKCTLKMARSKIPWRSLLVRNLKALHAQFNPKYDPCIFTLQIRTFLGLSFPDCWSRGTKTLGTRLKP